MYMYIYMNVYSMIEQIIYENDICVLRLFIYNVLQALKNKGKYIVFVL